MTETLPELGPDSVAVIYGTRPEMIKLAPLVRLLGSAVRLIHTGQHFDRELSDEIAADMDLPVPQLHANTGGKSRSSQIGSGVLALEPALGGVRAVVVQGDTNSALAGALTANALELPLFHVEAGLRSFDRGMPEEHNRVLIDHLADVCWAPTQGNVQNLLAEAVEASRIEETGNPIVEALEAVIPSASERSSRRASLEIHDSEYVVATLHRPENVDNRERLTRILEILGQSRTPVILPLHPRTAGSVERWGLDDLLARLRVRDSLGYRDFLSLLADSQAVVSDSGGIQEEVSILKIPLVVVRRSTERPEVIGTFASLISNLEELPHAIERVLGEESSRRSLAALPSPFGDGKASERMFRSLMRRV